MICTACYVSRAHKNGRLGYEPVTQIEACSLVKIIDSGMCLATWLISTQHVRSVTIYYVYSYTLVTLAARSYVLLCCIISPSPYMCTVEVS